MFFSIKYQILVLVRIWCHMKKLTTVLRVQYTIWPMSLNSQWFVVCFTDLLVF